MKYFLTIAASLALGALMLLVFYPGGTAARPETVLQKVLKSGVLRCGYAAWEPMLIVDPNTKKISGVSYDLIEEAAKKLALKVEWTEETSWAEYPQGLANNRFDAFCVAGWPNAPRARVIQFTAPFLFSAVNVYARIDDTRFDRDIEKLNDPSFRVIVIDGTTPRLIADTRFPKAERVGLPALTPFSDLFLSLSARKADATIMDSATADHFMKAHPGEIRLVPAGKNLRVFPHVFAVRMGEYDLQQALDTVLAELSNAGIIDDIVRRYEPLPDTYYRLAVPYAQ